MKKYLRSVLCSVIMVVMMLTIASCGSQVTGLIESYDEWRTDTTSRNKEGASTSSLISYDDVETAATADMTKSSNYLSLNGTWDFAYTETVASVPTDFMKLEFVYPDPSVTVTGNKEVLYWNSISVPGTFEMQGYGAPVYLESGYAWASDNRPSNVPATGNPVGLYRKTVSIPETWDGEEIYITLEGVSSACYVYVNGEMVGYGEDTYTTKSFRITDFVTAGEEALIAVKVFKYSYSSWIEAQDVIKFGGIFRDVYLTADPKVTIKDVTIDPGLDSDYANATMLVNIDLASYIEPPTGYTLEIQVLDQDGGVYLANRKLGGEVTFKTTKDTGSNYYYAAAGGRVGAEAPIKWSAENPYLYTAIITLKDDAGEVADIKSVRFGYVKSGFTVDDEGNQYLTVNGEIVKLYGVVYNEFNAATGSAITYEQKVEDIKNLKAMNVNAVRSPGVPFSTEFIELCDEYGMYVVSDINLESEPYSVKGDASIPGDQTIWQNVLIDRLYSVVERDKNNASIVMWGLGNQSGQGSNFKALRNMLTDIDDRLIIYDGDRAYSDLLVTNDWSMTKINEFINDEDNNKALIIESFDMGFLNGAGEISSYVNLIDTEDKVQGGFFSYYIDKALYWPKDTANASATLKETPYSENSSLYQLTYSGSWGEPYSDSNKGLTGLLSANRTWQSEAFEYKNAFSPIAVKAVDVRAGKFTAYNRTAFTALEDAYEIVYEVYKEADLVKSGEVSLSLLPGETKEFTIDYGTLDANVDYFVDITVKELSPTAWSDITDGVVAAWQFDVTGFETLPLTGGEETSFGDALEVLIVEKPEILTTVFDLISGYFYVTNNYDVNLGEIYDCSFEVYETNNFWENPRPVLISSGDVALDVPAYAENVKLQMVYDNEQKAVEGGDYLVKLKFTTKKAIGDIPAGYVLVWNFNEETLGAPIPFEVDPSRTPVQVVVDGVPLTDEKGNPVMEGGDPEPATVPEVDINDEALADQETYDPYTLVQNDRIKIIIDNASGTIIKFSIDEKDIFASSSTNSTPEFVLYRNPTGGDLNADVTGKDNNSIVTLSRNNTTAHKLTEAIKIKQVAANHYQFVMNYALVTYDYNLFSNITDNTYLTVTYDIFGNGEIVISYAYDAALSAGIPTEIGNIVVLDGGYDTFSWYGRGLGESYPDRLANTRVSVYEDIDISELVSTKYLYGAGNGDRNEVRWLTVDGDENVKLLISSTSNNFAFNVSYNNGLSAPAYARDAKSNNVFLRLIAEQRGVSAGNIVDANNYVTDSVIEPGQYVEFSYRIKPITDSDDAMSLAKTYINVEAPTVEKTEIVSGDDYSLVPVSSEGLYLTASEDGISIAQGYGSDNQLWRVTFDNSTGFDAYKIESIGMGGILTPAHSIFATNTSSLEVGIGKYDRSRHWGLWFMEEEGIMPLSIGWGLTAMSPANGTHVVLKAPEDFEGDSLAMWTFEPIEKDSDIYRLVNKRTGSYLTVIDEVQYRNALIEVLAERKFNYYGDVDWNSYSALNARRPVDNGTGGEAAWAVIEKSLTIWDLLPNESQTWTFTKVAEGEYKLVNSSTGKALAYDGSVLSEQAVSNNNNQIWQVIDDNGVYGLVNKANGGALTLDTIRVELTEDELAEIYAIYEDDYYKQVSVLTVKPWTGAATQKWILQSDAEKEIVIEAGEDWFTPPSTSEE